MRRPKLELANDFSETASTDIESAGRSESEDLEEATVGTAPLLGESVILTHSSNASSCTASPTMSDISGDDDDAKPAAKEPVGASEPLAITVPAPDWEAAQALRGLFEGVLAPDSHTMAAAPLLREAQPAVMQAAARKTARRWTATRQW